MELQREYLRDMRRKARKQRSYFDEDDDDDLLDDVVSDILASNGANEPTGEDEIDPLDAFMAGIDAQVTKEQQETNKHSKPKEKPLVFHADDEQDLSMHTTKRQTTTANDAYMDSDEEVYATAKKIDQQVNGDEDTLQETSNVMEVLAPLDHSKIVYESFRKDFYKPHAGIAKLTPAQVQELRKELQVSVQGDDIPAPVQSFMHVGLDRKTLSLLMKLGMEAPTPIQAQTFPIALSGRDMIGIAKTGSGKTLAFTLPMVEHVMDQRELRKGEGPIAIVLSPTRELAHQIFTQAKKFLSLFGAACAAVYGGVGKWDQIQAMRKGAEVVVATPGRLIEMIRKRTVKTNRVSFVVLDEADRMFEMGFEAQLRSIMGQIRPDRQTLLFSATFRRRIEALALDILSNPIKITVGQVGQSNEDIRQVAVVLPSDNSKWNWLMSNLQSIASEGGRVLIFASSKAGVGEMTKNLNIMKFSAVCLHGDKLQHERSEALQQFRSGQVQILVATDVAARGLDIKDIKNVINYDVAKNIDIHVHRIGRTGRMGVEGFEPGTAYTLLTMKESQFAAQLVYNMDISGQAVSADLIALAKRDPRFRRGMVTIASGSNHKEDAKARTIVDVYEDAEEMARWSESRRKRKADQRKGLGFAGLSTHKRPMMGLVEAQSTSRPNALASSFQSAFVKASQPEKSIQHHVSRSQPAVKSPPAPPIPSAFASAPPPVPMAAAVSLPPPQVPIAPPPPSMARSVQAKQVAPSVKQETKSNEAMKSPSRRSRSRRTRSRSRSVSSSPRSRSRSRRSRSRSRRSRSRSRNRRSRSRSRSRRSRSTYRSRSRSRSRRSRH